MPSQTAKSLAATSRATPRTQGPTPSKGAGNSRGSQAVSRPQMSGARQSSVRHGSQHPGTRQGSLHPGTRQTGRTVKSNLVQSRADTIIYEHTPEGSQVTGGSQRSRRPSQFDSQYDEDEYDEDEEYEEEPEEDEEDDYYSYDEDYYPQYVTPEPITTPRVVVSGGPEPCSCYPIKSSKSVPSMLYEKLVCKHTGIQGETHAGAYRFDFNWNDFYEEPRKKKKSEPPPKTTFVKGYPRPEFMVEYDEEDEDYDENEEEEEEYEDDDEYDYDQVDAGFSEYYYPDNDYEHDEDNEYEDEEEIEKAKTGIRALLPIPQIGYSPPPSGRQRSAPESLPPLPDSPFLTVSRQSGDTYYGSDYGSREGSAKPERKFRVKRKVEKDRRFQGQMYDPVSKKMMSYDIKPIYKNKVSDWEAEMAKPPSTVQSKRSKNGRISSRLPTGSMRSRMHTGQTVRSKRSTIPEEDEYYDEEDDED